MKGDLDFDTSGDAEDRNWKIRPNDLYKLTMFTPLAMQYSFGCAVLGFGRLQL